MREGRRRRYPGSPRPPARTQSSPCAGGSHGLPKQRARTRALRTPRSTVLKLLPGAAGASVRGKAACHLLPPRARAEPDELGTQISPLSRLIAPGLCS